MPGSGMPVLDSRVRIDPPLLDYGEVRSRGRKTAHITFTNDTNHAIELIVYSATARSGGGSWLVPEDARHKLSVNEERTVAVILFAGPTLLGKHLKGQLDTVLAGRVFSTEFSAKIVPPKWRTLPFVLPVSVVVVALLVAALLSVADTGRVPTRQHEPVVVATSVGSEVVDRPDREATEVAKNEAKARAEREEKEREAKARAEREAKARVEREAKEQEAKARAVSVAKAFLDRETKARAEREAKARVERETKARAEREAKARYVGTQGPSHSRPWVAIAGSISQSSAKGRRQADKLAKRLRRAGFDAAKTYDGRDFPNFSCCYWSVILGGASNSAGARDLCKRAKTKGFDCYAKRGWK